MPIHLCTYHVTSAWHKGICQHMKKPMGSSDPSSKPKHLIASVFKGIHLVMKHPGADTLEGSKAAVRIAMAAFKAQWQATQPDVVSYFVTHWEGKIGAYSCQNSARRLLCSNFCNVTDHGHSTQAFHLSDLCVVHMG